MPATYDSISSTTLTSNQSSIVLSSIPQTYTDLRLVFYGTSTNNAQAQVRFNSDSSSSYSYQSLTGTSTTISGDKYNSAAELYMSYYAFSSIPASCTMDIFSYAGSTQKFILMQSSVDPTGIARVVSLYRSTTAISSITIINPGFSFQSGTTVSLYGITRA
jgi:hypothetical protein